MRRPVHLIRPLVALALAACGRGADSAAPDPVDPAAGSGIWAGNVVAEGRADGVVVGNNTTRPVGVFAAEEQILPVILWTSCTVANDPRLLAPGERRLLGRDAIPGVDVAKGRRTVHVYWWHPMAQRDGSTCADSVRAMVVRIPG